MEYAGPGASHYKEPYAGTDQEQQVRPVEPAPPSLCDLQSLVGHQQFLGPRARPLRHRCHSRTVATAIR